MDLNHFNYIIEVAKTGSISKTAQRLFMSQPYLSKIIREVEEELKIYIFIRTSQGVVLTPQGEKFVNHAKLIMEAYDNLFSLSNKQSPIKNGFKISTVRSSLVMESFITLIREYMEHGLEFTIKETDSKIPVDDVYFLNADLGIIYLEASSKPSLLKELKRKNIAYKKITQFSINIVLGVGHPLLNKKGNLAIDDLYDYGLVRYSRNSLPTYDEEISYDFGNSILDMDKIKSVINVSDRASLHNILTQTDFFFVGIQGAKKQEEIFNIVSIPLDGIDSRTTVEMGVIYLENLPLNPIAERFIEILSDTYCESD